MLVALSYLILRLILSQSSLVHASNTTGFSNSTHTQKPSSYGPFDSSLRPFSGSLSLLSHISTSTYDPSVRESAIVDAIAGADPASRTVNTELPTSTNSLDTSVPNSGLLSTILLSSLNSTPSKFSDVRAHTSTVGGTDLGQTLSQLDTLSPSTPTTIANDTSIVGNSSIDIDACFTQWSSFWSASASDYSTFVSSIGGTTWFSSEVTSRTTLPAIYPTTSTSLTIETETISEYAGGFPIGETTSTWTYGVTYTYSSYSPASTSTTIYEQSSAVLPSSSTTITAGSSLITPACQLPSIVPQCQSQWASYESRKFSDTSYNFTITPAPAPICPHASIGTALCNDLKDNYISSWIEEYAENPYVQPYLWSGAGSVGVASTQPDGSVVWTSTFPTWSSFAPGCTLGCARCAITGGRVRLLYWPVPQTSSLNVSNSAIITSDAGTTAGPVIASVSGIRLTSPTVYISYHSLYASDSCSAVGANHSATIIPIPESNMLSSFYFTWATNGQIAQTSSFNFADLNTPVPENVFTRQPACYWSGCPKSLTAYEPILVVPPSIVQSIDPAWSTCSLDILGLYDPPYALHGAPEAATPVASDPWPTTTPALPASAPQATYPQPSVTLNAPHLISSILSFGNDPLVGNPSGDPSRTASMPSNQDPAPSKQTSSEGEHSSFGGDPTSGGDPSGGNVTPSKNPSGGDPVTSGDPASSGYPSGKSDSGSSSSEGDPVAGNAGSADPKPSGAGSNAQSPPQGQSADPGRANSGSADPVVTSASRPPASQKISSLDGQATNGIGAAIISGLGGGGQSEQSAADGNDPSPPQEPDNTGAVGSATSLLAEVGGQSISADPNTPGAVIVAGHTLKSGLDTVIRGTTVSVGTAGLMIGGSPIPMPTAGAADTPTVRLTLADTTLTAQTGRPFVIGGTTLSTNGAAATIDGQTVRVGDSAIIVETRTIPYSSTVASAAATFTAGGRPHTVQAGKALIIDGTTLPAGESTAVVDGEAISFGNSGIIVGTKTVPFGKPVAATTSGAIITLGSSSITAFDQNDHIVVGSQTLSSGSAAAIISGKTFSMAPSGIVIDGIMHSFSQIPAISAASVELEATFGTPGAPFTVFESPKDPSIAVIVGANSIPTTLSLGGSAAIINGQTVSLGSHGLMAESSEISFSSVPATGTLEEAATFTDPSGHVHTALEGLGDGHAAVVDGSIAMTVGGAAVTIGGDVVSLASNGLLVNQTSSVGFTFTVAESSGATVTGSSRRSDTMAASATGKQGPNVSQAKRSPEAGFSAWAMGLGFVMVSFLIPYAM